MSPDGWVYIQDMARLVKPERRNVAWTKELLVASLIEIGLEICGSFDLVSHSGKPHAFGIMCRNSLKPKIADSRSIIARHRSNQSAKLLSELSKITRGVDHVDELIILQHEFSCLEVQLSDAHFTKLPQGHDSSFEKIGIPIRPPVEDQLEYACSLSGLVSQKSGMIAIMSSKRLLDLPKLIGSAKHQIRFGGYSNRPLFLSEGNILALGTAIRTGAVVRVMVVAAECAVAQLRADGRIKNADGFLADIGKQSLEAGTSS